MLMLWMPLVAIVALGIGGFLLDRRVQRLEQRLAALPRRPLLGRGAGGPSPYREPGAAETETGAITPADIQRAADEASAAELDACIQIARAVHAANDYAATRAIVTALEARKRR